MTDQVTIGVASLTKLSGKTTLSQGPHAISPQDRNRKEHCHFARRPRIHRDTFMATWPSFEIKKPTLEQLEELYTKVKSSDLPYNRVETVAQAFAYLANDGLSASEKGLSVSANKIHDLEQALFENWPDCLKEATVREQKRERDRIFKRRKRNADKEFMESIEARLLRWEKAFPLLLSTENAQTSRSQGTNYSESADVVANAPYQSAISDFVDSDLCATPTDLDTLLGLDLPKQISFSLEDCIPTAQGGQPATSILLAKELLGRVHLLDSTLVCTDEELNQNTLIQAALYGWQAVFENKVTICPLWKILSIFDQHAKRRNGIVTHMAFLHAIHSLSISLCANGALPTWYRPRPTQIAFPHDSFLDYFPWPGLRERLVVWGQPAITDDFWNLYIACCHFIWPFPNSEAYERNAESGRYRFSELYKACLEDLRSYTLDHRFFAKYPEVYEDVAPFMVNWYRVPADGIGR
ncbi:hypothetical protein TCE0_017r03997 [Talaromyces pinophilus]|uniref:Uncharacterized protein n=1 Tax=Talaromyces pinophilus TaxID=128442 RepID=A0A6V8H2T4_TALPI|nr:hypothetical protein TCE0_017r03997 [Talaromyces pinophilus]